MRTIQPKARPDRINTRKINLKQEKRIVIYKELVDAILENGFPMKSITS